MRRSTVVIIAAALAAALVPAPALAGPLVGAVAGIFTSIGVAAGAATILGEVVVAGLTVAANYAIQSLFGPKASPFSTQIQLNSGGVVPRSFLFGEAACTAGSLIYHGATAAGGHTPNAYYVAEYALSDLPIDSLTGIFVDGTAVTWDPDATPGTFGISIPEYNSGGSDYLWVTFSDGTQTGADSFMRTWFGSDADYPYTSDMVGTGVAKVRIVARVNQSLFPSAPQFQFVCGGIPLYDIRADTTAGGSGSQRWNTPSTWTATGNPAVVLYNVIRGMFYGSAWFYGGQNLDAARLPYASWAAAANACDMDVDLAAGGTEKQFRTSGEIQLATQPADAITMLLACCSGRPAEIAGSYKILIGAAGAAVVSITDDDILVSEEQQFDPFPNLDSTINAITARYPEPTQAYALTDAPPLYNSSYETADGNRRLVSAVEFDFATSNTQVQRLMKALVEEARRFRKHSQVMPPSMYQLEPLDVVSFTSTRNGYSDKLFRIDAVTDGDNCDQAWSLTEVDPADFDWDPSTDEQAVSNPPLVTQRPAAQAIVDWAVSGIAVSGDNGTAKAGLRLAWNAAVDDVSGVQFQVRLASDQTIVLSGSTVDLAAGLVDLTQNLLPNTNYEARGKYIPISARETTWSDWLAATTPDIGVSQGELDAGLNAAIQQVLSGIPADMLIVRQMVEDLAAATASQITTITERLGQINIGVGARYQQNQATAELALSASATDRAVLAAIFGETFATTDAGTADALLRIIAASSLDDGDLALIQFNVQAGFGGQLASAALELAAVYTDALGLHSRIRLQADQLDFIVNGVTLPAASLVVSNAPHVIADISGTVRADLSDHETQFATTLSEDVTMQFPIGGWLGYEWSHTFTQDNAGGHAVNVDPTVFISDAPAILSNAGYTSEVRCRITNLNPPQATALFLSGGNTQFGLDSTSFSIYPPVNGYSTWDVATDGPLVCNVPGTYVLTVCGADLQVQVELWGPGGSSGTLGSQTASDGHSGAADGQVGAPSTFQGMTANPGAPSAGVNSDIGTIGGDQFAGGTALGGDTNETGSPGGRSQSGYPQNNYGGAAAGTGGGAATANNSDVTSPQYSNGIPGNGPGGGASGILWYNGKANGIAVSSGGGGGGKATKRFTAGVLLSGIGYTIVIGDSGAAGIGDSSSPLRNGGKGASGGFRISA